MDQRRSKPIGFFDSGVGGLTVLKEALRILPKESYIYIGDTKNVPYGTKDPQLITRLSIEIAKILLKHDCKAIVIACNTVSAIALPEIQRIAGDIPVIGVIEPTVKHIATMEKTGTIGIIATSATINSQIYEKKINYLTHGKRKIISKATSLFVPLIEKNSHDIERIRSTIKESLDCFKQEETLDTLILGCTHYPLIKDHIASFLGENVTIIDSSYPTVMNLKNTLTQNDLLSLKPNIPTIFFTADDPRLSIQIASKLLGNYVVTKNL